MSRFSGAKTLMFCAALELVCARAAAQDGQVIEDPEMGGGARPAASGGKGDQSGGKSKPGRTGDEEDDAIFQNLDQQEQVVRDPELEGVPLGSELLKESTSAQKETAEGPSTEPSSSSDGAIEDPELAGVARVAENETDSRTTLQLELHSRVGVDTRWENDVENIVESTTIAALEVNFRRSETVRFAAGLRARYHYARRRTDVKGDGEGPSTFELDMVPTAGYADVTIADGVHVRAGYQTIAIGRFDFFSGTNFLALRDLRDGPATIPGASEIAQPALRADIDLASWLTLQAWYVPIFQPDIVSIYGSDYSMLSGLDKLVLQGIKDAKTPEDKAKLKAFFDSLPRKKLGQLSASAVRSLGPEPNFAKPQAAMRLTARASDFEVALTAETVVSHSPTIKFNDAVVRLPPNPDDPQLAADQLAAAFRSATSDPSGLVSIENPRFNVLSLDAATDIGAVQLGFEATYINGYPLYSGPRNAQGTPTPVPEKADIAHLGLRGEYVESNLQISVESFSEYALKDPPRLNLEGIEGVDPRRRWSFFVEKGRWLGGGAAVVRWVPGGGKLSMDLFGLAVLGPSVIVTPRLEYAVAENLWFELGAIIVEGPNRPIGDPKATVGGLYDDTDQVFTGVRWMP